jgi:hypothetical protein
VPWHIGLGLHLRARLGKVQPADPTDTERASSLIGRQEDRPALDHFGFRRSTAGSNRSP